MKAQLSDAVAEDPRIKARLSPVIPATSRTLPSSNFSITPAPAAATNPHPEHPECPKPSPEFKTEHPECAKPSPQFNSGHSECPG